jgi:homoserine kinase
MTLESNRKGPPVKRKSAEVRPREFLTPLEVESLRLAALDRSRNPLRDSALILLCYRHALGVNEIITLKWDNIDLENRILRIFRERSAIETEHGLEEDEVSLLQLWKEKMPRSEHVFISERRGVLNERTVGAIVAQAGRNAGFEFSVNPSILRHSKGLQMARQGLESHTIQAYLGQKTLGRSRHYVQQGQQGQKLQPELDARMQKSPTEQIIDSCLLGSGRSREDLLSGRALTLRVPLSTCNLGPGLDALGLALNLYTYVTLSFDFGDVLSSTEKRLVSLDGNFAKSSKGSDIGDLIYTLLQKLWKNDPGLLKRARLSLKCDLPLGCGVGTAGTAILGALWASHVLQDSLPTRTQLLSECVSTEGHVETMAASLLGSMVVCGGAVNGSRVVAQTIPWPEDWLVIMVVPPYTLITPRSRQVVPNHVNLADAVSNIRNSTSMVAAVINHDPLAMNEVMKDALHEPARSNLIPELPSLRAELADAPIIGCVLSGGGPAVLVLVQKIWKDKVLDQVRRWNQRQKSACEIYDLCVDTQGMTVL